MRLLRCSDTGDFSLTQFPDKVIPRYAILSHTWRADAEEVTFEDLTNGTGKNKAGHEKIWFCGEQARQDGLQHFWIDTCCIDKANKAELSQAIQSMFRWYRNAARCYVYLHDVTVATDEEANPPLWESAFRKSKWFTRGWTLQELLAPSTVEFFCRERRKLGDKTSLTQHIYEVTGIPHSALQGAPLSQFSVKDRLRWSEHRQTTRPEDKAYSLLGVVGVDLAPCYGEGAEGAFKRLHDEISKLERCVQDIHSTDPRDDKKRIEYTKGGLLKASYRWVLDNIHFQQWHNDPQSRLLWIKGDPGKGKTMLLCGIIDELQQSIAKTGLVSYFFCQATDSRINTATAVLRGLLFLLVSQQPSLVAYVRKKYDHAGKTMFEDANAWVALTEIFTDVLQDPGLNATYLIIDALDECVTDLPKLLDFVAKHSSVSSRVKWIVSSRNWPAIEEQLERTGHKVRLSLELNAESVSTAVQTFIEQKVSQLAQQKKYDERTRDSVLEHLASNANDTFLWVALVCQDLEMTAKRNVLKKLNSFPPGLDSLYKRMMQQISKSDDAELCKQVLASIALVYRPITLKELAALVEQLGEIADDKELREIIGLCGSFLILREDTIYFVHQSAKDFLLAQAAEQVFPSGREDVHHAIVARSLEIMSRTLQRDMYGLKAPGYPIDDIKQPDSDPLATSRYSCIYWVDHLCDWNPSSSAKYEVGLQDGGAVDSFLRQQYLYWLEALSLCKSISQGVVSMAKLEVFMQGRANASALNELVRDARRFIMAHKSAIENSPLQSYASALLFSPTRSPIRSLFKREEPNWITIAPAMEEKWGACLQTLEGHSGSVYSVVFSPDSTRLASGSDRMWIAYDSENVLWLPSEYRSSRFIVSKNRIGIGTSHGKVWICSVEDKKR
ncbi:NACHT domain-containing protein [Lineolata rhizophorae]|uniref:NACHT domain-containing protein n=1 Tax=Lineolata rhizophorae TaxID=578093 RepID=A0A6A6NKM4_9PEZI|nr:NACHT domain-containing protein [Lineolata rhizophorae]